MRGKALHRSGFYGRVARRKPLLGERQRKAGSQTVINKILWSDETKIEQFGLNSWGEPGTAHHLPDCIFQRQELVRVEGKLNEAKYRDILIENLVQVHKTRPKIHLPTGQ